jgi:hypothetical protein
MFELLAYIQVEAETTIPCGFQHVRYEVVETRKKKRFL